LARQLALWAQRIFISIFVKYRRICDIPFAEIVGFVSSSFPGDVEVFAVMKSAFYKS